jgi:pimeloyl-ACP methyl ester carboxylesterase
LDSPIVRPRTAVLLAGWNQPPEHFSHIVDGSSAIPGLRAYGFNCVPFPAQDDRLRERIDRLATFLETLHAMGHPFPVILIGYSTGGLVARGFLRAYPHRAHEVSHTIMIASPNWGADTYVLSQITQFMQVPDKSMWDLNLNSDFLTWLNGTGGHYINGSKMWTLDKEPWVGPEGARLFTIMGLIPGRGGDNDGLVWGDSATLASRIPAHYVIGPHCNHMNIIGQLDPFVTLSTGFLANDRVWPHTLRAILRFTQAQPLGSAKG